MFGILEKSFKEKVEGIVYVRIEIDEHGNVILAVPLLGLDEDCNAEATRICKTLHYTPRITDDEPVGEYRTVAVPFYINKMIQAQIFQFIKKIFLQ